MFPKLDAVASDIKMTSYPWLKASRSELSTEMRVSIPAKMRVSIPRFLNHTSISVSWKAEKFLNVPFKAGEQSFAQCKVLVRGLAGHDF